MTFNQKGNSYSNFTNWIGRGPICFCTTCNSSSDELWLEGCHLGCCWTLSVVCCFWSFVEATYRRPLWRTSAPFFKKGSFYVLFDLTSSQRYLLFRLDNVTSQHVVLERTSCYEKMGLIISNESTTTTFEMQQRLLTTNKNGYSNPTLSKPLSKIHLNIYLL